MVNVSWYPETTKERYRFALRTFPMFIVLLVFLYFGLDWIGAFEFLEVLVRNNSKWLLETIWDYDPADITIGFFQRIDHDPITGGSIYFGQPYFPGIQLATYPRILLIIRACTGMEAGALLMALILVTPAKWENKVGATVTNFLMMHIGNTFRVAFHFWYTQHLYQKYIAQGMLSYDAADKAFAIAHDSLSKVFGFVGIVIFTLVIERTGVKIVSTFGAWIDALADFLRRRTEKISSNAYYLDKKITHEKLANAEEEVPSRVEEIDKVNFYPKDEINNNKWSSFLKTFGPFVLVAIAIIGRGLIPQVNKIIGLGVNSIASAFGVTFQQSESLNILWWSSKVTGASAVEFIMNPVSTGILLLAIMVALIIVTPGKWPKKITAMSLMLLIIPLNMLRLAVQEWGIFALVSGSLKSTKPLLYLNLYDVLMTWYPFIFWTLLVILLFYICKWLDVKAFNMAWSWIHQLTVTLGWIVGLRDKPGKVKVEDEELEVLVASSK